MNGTASQTRKGTSLVRKPPISTDLTLVADVRLPDAYEQDFMGDAGVVLHRDRHHAPWRLHAAFAILVGSVAVAALVTGESLGLIIGLPTVALAWLLFSVLRVTVSTRHVNVQYGLFGRKIPVAAIESSEVITYDWFWGWRSRRSHPGKWISRFKAVRIAWRDRKGSRCVTLIGSRRADVLAAQIDRARSMLTTGMPPPALGPER